MTIGAREIWSVERVEQLKKLFADGLSFSAIANEMACGLSRNAVLGKASRLGLVRGRAVTAKPERTPRAPSAKPSRFTVGIAPPSLTPRSGNNIVDRLKASAADPGVSDELMQPSADGVGLSLIDLTNGSCRWPIGDPLQEGFLFCGDSSADFASGRPYCRHHTRLSIDKTRIRSAKAFERSAISAAK